MNPAPVASDSGSAVVRNMNHAVVEGDLEAIAQFVARVLRRAHRAAMAQGAASEARAILGVAHMFADELTVSDPRFDRLGFVRAVT
jgi:hypothetical protein